MSHVINSENTNSNESTIEIKKDAKPPKYAYTLEEAIEEASKQILMFAVSLIMS